jgi:hypothetical protein
MMPEPVSLDPDPVIEAYKRDVDRTLLRENLKLSPEERLLKLPLVGLTCRCATLEALIRMKRAAGRPKDFEALAELEALREERRRQ